MVELELKQVWSMLLLFSIAIGVIRGTLDRDYIHGWWSRVSYEVAANLFISVLLGGSFYVIKGCYELIVTQ